MGSANSRVSAAALALAAAAALALPYSAPWQALNHLWLDEITRWRAAQHAGDPDIVVVAIDEYSVRAMAGVAGSWPWPRSIHADLVVALKDAGAAAVVFDVLFAEPDRFRPEHDAYFGEVLDAHADVFLSTLLLGGGATAEVPRVADYPASLGLVPVGDADPESQLDILVPAVGEPTRWQVGAINLAADFDGRARRYPTWVDANDWRLPSLPTRVVADLDGQTVPDAALRIDWRKGAGPAYQTVPFADLYARLLRGEPLDPDTFSGRLVVVGVTASGLHDMHATPLATHYPGVYVLANAIDNLRKGHALRMVPAPAESAAIAAWLLLAALAWRRRWGLIPLLGALAAITVALGAVSAAAGLRGLLVPVAATTTFAWLLFLATAVAQYVNEYRARLHALDLFGRFVDPTVVKDLAARGLADESTHARDCEITVLFSDIRGFTTLSETRPAHEVMALLNAYFDRQVGVIFHHGGTLDKFIGDAIMAFWGAPVAMPDHAQRAVAAALDMVEQVDAFQGLDIGIGIHTGPAVVGMLGSALRYDYTAIGDTVNLASRIEGLTKGRSRILVSEATRRACGDAFEFVQVGTSEVKGRAECVTLHTPGRKR